MQTSADMEPLDRRSREWDISQERAKNILRQAVAEDEFNELSPILVGKRMYPEPECTTELLEFMALFLASHQLDAEEFQEILLLDPTDEEDALAAIEALCVLGWVYRQREAPKEVVTVTVSIPVDQDLIAVDGRTPENEEQKGDLNFLGLKPYQTQDIVVDVIQGMVFDDKRVFFERDPNYQTLCTKIFVIPEEHGISVKQHMYRLRARSAQLNLDNLSDPNPLLDGPNCFELMAMVSGFMEFAHSYRFTADSNFVAAVLKVRFEEPTNKQQDPWEFWDNVAVYNRRNWGASVNWKRHFTDSASQTDVRFPLLMKREGTELHCRSWTEDDDAQFVCGEVFQTDDRRQYLPQKIVSHFSASCIGLDATTVGGVVRVYVTFAGHRLRLRGTAGLWKIMSCMSQMIVVEKGTVNANEVMSIAMEVGHGCMPAFEPSEDCVKLVFLNHHVCRAVIDRFAVDGVRLGQDDDYDALSGAVDLPFIRRRDDVFVDSLQRLLRECPWFADTSARRKVGTCGR